METWWRYSGREIESFPVEKSTEHFLFIPQSQHFRAHRMKRQNSHFQTFAECKTYTLAMLARRVEQCRNRLAETEVALHDVSNQVE